MKIFDSIPCNRKKWLKIMRISCTQLLLALLFVGITYARDSNAQVNLNRKISLNMQDVRISKILRKVEKITHTKFVYSLNVVDVSKEVTVSAEDESLAKVLDEILTENGIGYEVIHNRIILKPLSEGKEVIAHQLTSPVPSLIEEAELTVHGKVTDDKGNPLVGVTVQVKGTDIGTVTNEKGRYVIHPTSGRDFLDFSYVGYTSKSVAVNNRNKINISLQRSSSGLNEVVVVGYGTQKKKDLTGAITSVSGDAATKDRTVTSLADMLEGRAAGVQVTEDDGAPGADALIRIRGTGSVYGSNAPLYVIDGVVGDGVDVSPGDIQSVEILKDASATAIYGSRGSNGVIIITTKHGTKGKIMTNFYASEGISSIPKYIDMMNSVEYARAYDYIKGIEYIKKGSGTPPIGSDAYYDAEQNYYVLPAGWGDWVNYNNPDSTNTNWQKLMYRSALIKNYRLNVSGGGKENNFYLSLNYLGQEGILINSGATKLSGRLNFQQNLSKNLTMSLELNALKKERYGDVSGNANSIVMTILQQPPTKDRNFTGNIDGTTTVDSNPYYNATHTSMTNTETKLISSLILDWKINRFFRFRTQNSYTNDNSEGSNFYPSMTNTGMVTNGLAQLSTENQYELTSDNLLYFNKTISKIHKISAMLGVSYDLTNKKELNVSNTDFTVETLGANAIGLGTDPEIPTNSITKATLASIFARINYSLKDRYLFTFTLRRDGSSRFGSNNEYATFPSAAFAWRLDQTKFIRDLNIINTFKLRSSFGESGNQAVPSYLIYSTLKTEDATLDGVNTSFGVAPDQVGNAALKWETTAQADLGLDLGLFNSRINFTFDVYKKRTFNLLNKETTPLYTGYSTTWTNFGTIQNKGLDFNINIHIISGNNLNWTTSYNMSFDRSKVIKINQNGYILINSGYSSLGDYSLVEQGKPIGLWYGYVVTGIYQSQSDIDKSGITQIQKTAISEVQPGWQKIKDINGDGVIDANDQVILGNGNPKYTGGFINQFSYKGIDLSVAFQFSYGADIFNATKVKLLRARGDQNLSTDLNNSWFPDLYHINPDGSMGSLVIKGNPSNKYPLTGFTQNDFLYNQDIEDGSYIRLSDLTIGYNLPEKIAKRVKFSSVRVFMSAKNLFLFTKYSGYDPEVNTSNNSQLAPGMDYGAYPKARTFSLGIQASL